MAEQKVEPMNLGVMVIGLSVVGFLFAGPGWYLWMIGPKIIGGILLGITGIAVLITMGSGSFGRAAIAYICGLITTRISFAILVGIFGGP